MKKKIAKELLQENISFEIAEKIQFKYSQISKKINAKVKNLIHEEEINIITAVDVSYYLKDGREWGISYAVFWDKKQNKIIKSSFERLEIKIPYKAGFLGFRESKVITLAIEKANLEPDLLICDGHGLIHPRNFGEAVHLGLALNIPSFGVAKNPYIGYYNKKAIERRKGNRIPIWEMNPNERPVNNKILGYYTCLADNRKPVFISAGYKIAIDTAIEIALRLSSDNRQPEVLYIADKLSKNKIKEQNND